MPRRASAQNFLATHWVLIAILLLALFLRLFYFVGVVRGDDFAFTYYAHKLSLGELEATGPYPGLDRPGLYAPVAALFALFGSSEFVATLFPLLASLVTIFFICKIGELLAGKKAGLLAAFLWAVFPLAILMSAQVDPEAPLAFTITGAIYCLLLAYQAKTRGAKAAWFLATAFFMVWAFLTKLSGVPILFVIVAFLLIWSWDGILGFYRKQSKQSLRVGGALLAIALLAAAGFLALKQPWPIVINNLELTASDVSRVLIGRSTPVQRADVGGDYWVTRREVFVPAPEPQTLTHPDGAERFKVFDPFLLLFLVAVGYALTQRKRAFILPLVWFAILFFYLEWGPFPRSLTQILSFIYVPVNHWIAHDNLLFLCVPFVLVLAIYLAEGLTERNVGGYLLLAIIAVLAFVLALDYLPARELAFNYVDLSLVLAVALSALSPFVLLGRASSKARQATVFGLLISLVGVAALLPSAHYHAWDYFKERERRDNLQAVIAFLEEQPALPIYAGFNSMPMDLYSGYQYGFAYMKEAYNYPQTRMTRDLDLIAREGGYFLREGCGNPVFELRHWPLAEFGDSASPECISLVRSLPVEQAMADLPASQALAESQHTQEDINIYLATAASAEDLGEFIHALSLYTTYYPEDMPISEAQGLLVRRAADSPASYRTDLIEWFESNEANWEFGSLLQARLSQDEALRSLDVRLVRTTLIDQPIAVHIKLKPNTAYVIEFEFRSFASFDLVRFPDHMIPDSYPDSWNKDLAWTNYKVAFVTPDFEDGETEVTIELARIYDKGFIRFRQLELIEIPVDAIAP